MVPWTYRSKILIMTKNISCWKIYSLVVYRQIGTCHWRRQWQPTPVLLPGKSHGRKSLVGCSPWGREESDTTEWLHFPFSLSYIGKGNGNSFQCSCLENPRDGGAWWAAFDWVAQSWTRLKRLSSSSSSDLYEVTDLAYGWTLIGTQGNWFLFKGYYF